ncbi:MAG: carboxypeptidase regulatory-like domain-containing protein [Vicinamibacterales bacterium]
MCAFSPAAEGQVLYGSIVGNVQDGTGAAVPGASVTITHDESKATRNAVTDGAGAYRFPTLQPGTYTVVVTLTGFRTFTRNEVAVTLNTVTRVDATLPVGQLQETVTVSGERPVLQTDRAEIRQELRSRDLRDLPVPVGRNYQELFATLPGFTPPEEAHSIPSNPSRALVFNVNGASRSSNNTRIDGVSSQNVWLPHVVAYVPALESIETVNVVTNNFDAEQGLAGGSAISVQIKSGTNTLHGSAFEYHNNERLRARNYFDPPDTNKGRWRFDQYGGTLGGPLLRNRLFYFASYEGTRRHENVSRTMSVPTDAVRRGDFTGTGTTIYDPFTGNPDGTGRLPFPGNVIPANRISPVAQKMIPFIPLPNLNDADGSIPEFSNYFVQAPFAFNRWTLDTKVNWNASDRLHIFGRYSQLDFWQDNKTVFGEQLQGNPSAGGNPGVGWGDTYNFSSGATYTFGSNVVVDGHFGWVRMDSNVEMSNVGELQGLDWLGIPGTNGPNPWEGGLPVFDLDGYSDFGTTEDYMPYYRSDDQYQTVLNLNWLKGRHNIRVGSDIYFTSLNHIQPEIIDNSYGARGGFEFNGGPTQLRGGPGGTNFNSWASYLLGLPAEMGRLKLEVAPYKTRSWQYSFYARDQWQVTPKMTISYGTRWEYFPIPTRGERGLERYNLETNMVEVGGLGSVPKDLGVKMSKTLFAPRIGVTYRIGETAVVRGGFGITNDPYSLARSMRTNHPILLNLVEEAPHSFGWVRPIEEGIPVIPDADLSSGIIPVPGNVSVVTLPDDFDRGRVESWNVAFEKELKWGFVGEAAYVGTRQVNQLGIIEQNWSPIDGGSAGRQLFQKYGRTAATLLIGPLGNSTYNSLQTSLNRRFSNGIQLRVNYTLQRSNGIAGAPNSDNQPRVRIPDLYHLNHGISDFDRTHNLHITNLTELPFGRGRRWLNNGGVLATIVGGWQVNNILSFYSGRPFTVTSSGTSLNSPGSTQMADQIKNDVEIFGGVGRDNSYFDPLAFAPVTEARFGNAGFNTLRGPGVAQWDVGLFRQIPLGGTANVQLRVEAFNVTNRPHFANPGANRSSLRLNPDGSIRDLNGYTEITDTTGTKSERQIRLGIRFGF